MSIDPVGKMNKLAADVLDALLDRSNQKVNETTEKIAEYSSFAAQAKYSVHEFDDFLSRELRIDQALLALREKASGILSKLIHHSEDASKDPEGARTLIQELQGIYEKQQGIESLRYLLDRVHVDAVKILLDEESELLQEFKAHLNSACEAYVLCIDVRRSTDLMLKAKSPRAFSDFITGLTRKLKEIVRTNYGVYDKFTGDGVLAFYPKFFSGKDAGLRAIKTAAECHECFESHYRDHRSCFQAVLKSTGLGIGIDFGQCNLVRSDNDLTLIGTPVVYACRLAGSPPSTTLVNQPAFEELMKHSDLLDFTESSLQFKGDGEMIVYSVKRNQKKLETDLPGWAR